MPIMQTTLKVKLDLERKRKIEYPFLQGNTDVDLEFFLYKNIECERVPQLTSETDTIRVFVSKMATTTKAEYVKEVPPEDIISTTDTVYVKGNKVFTNDNGTFNVSVSVNGTSVYSGVYDVDYNQFYEAVIIPDVETDYVTQEEFDALHYVDNIVLNSDGTFTATHSDGSQVTWSTGGGGESQYEVDKPNITFKADQAIIDGAQDDVIATKADKTELANYTTTADQAVIDGTQNDNIALKADKTELPDMTVYYTKTEVDALIPTIDLTPYYTKVEVDGLIADFITATDLTTALADYYTKTEIDNLIAGLGPSKARYITDFNDWNEYLTSPDLETLYYDKDTLNKPANDEGSVLLKIGYETDETTSTTTKILTLEAHTKYNDIFAKTLRESNGNVTPWRESVTSNDLANYTTTEDQAIIDGAQDAEIALKANLTDIPDVSGFVTQEEADANKAFDFNLKNDLGITISAYDNMAQVYAAVIASAPVATIKEGTYFVTSIISGANKAVVQDLINEFYGAYTLLDNAVIRFTITRFVTYLNQQLEITTESGDWFHFTVNNIKVSTPLVNTDYFRQVNVHTANSNQANVVSMTKTTALTGVPDTPTVVTFDTVEQSKNDGVFTIGTNQLTVNYSGIYETQIKTNAMKTGVGTEGAYLLGIGVNGTPVKGNWQQGQITEGGTIDTSSIVNRFTGYLNAGDVIQIYHLDNGTGGIDLVDSTYNYPMYATASLLLVDGVNPIAPLSNKKGDNNGN